MSRLLAWWTAQSWHAPAEHALFSLLFMGVAALVLALQGAPLSLAPAAAIAAYPVVFFYARAEREAEDRLEATRGVKDELAWTRELWPGAWPPMQRWCFLAPLAAGLLFVALLLLAGALR